MRKFFKRFPTLVGALVLMLGFGVLQGMAHLVFLVEPLTFRDGLSHPVLYVIVSTFLGASLLFIAGCAGAGLVYLYYVARKIGRALTDG